MFHGMNLECQKTKMKNDYIEMPKGFTTWQQKQWAFKSKETQAKIVRACLLRDLLREERCIKARLLEIKAELELVFGITK